MREIKDTSLRNYECFDCSLRYYGGTNLGVGGFESSLKTAAKIAIDNGKIVEKLIIIRKNDENKLKDEILENSHLGIKLSLSY